MHWTVPCDVLLFYNLTLVLASHINSQQNILNSLLDAVFPAKLARCLKNVPFWSFNYITQRESRYYPPHSVIETPWKAGSTGPLHLIDVLSKPPCESQMSVFQHLRIEPSYCCFTNLPAHSMMLHKIRRRAEIVFSSVPERSQQLSFVGICIGCALSRYSQCTKTSSCLWSRPTHSLLPWNWEKFI